MNRDLLVLMKSSSSGLIQQLFNDEVDELETSQKQTQIQTQLQAQGAKVKAW